jgi:hypothetical protein
MRPSGAAGFLLLLAVACWVPHVDAHSSPPPSDVPVQEASSIGAGADGEKDSSTHGEGEAPGALPMMPSQSLSTFFFEVREKNRDEAFSFDPYDNSERAKQFRYRSSDAELIDSDMVALLDTPGVLQRGDVFALLFYARWDHFSQRFIPVVRAAAEMFVPSTASTGSAGEGARWLPVFIVDAARFPGYNARFGVFGFPRLFICNVTDGGSSEEGRFQRPTVHWRTFNSNNERFRVVDEASGINTVSLELFSEFLSNYTRVVPTRGVSDVRVRLPPLGRPTPEAGIYVFISGAMVMALAFYAVYVAWKVSVYNTGSDKKRD